MKRLVPPLRGARGGVVLRLKDSKAVEVSEAVGESLPLKINESTTYHIKNSTLARL